MPTLNLHSSLDLATFDIGAFSAATVSATASVLTYTLGTRVLRLTGTFTLSGGQPVAGSITGMTCTIGGVQQFAASGSWGLFDLYDAIGNGDLPSLFDGADTVNGGTAANVLRGFGGDDLLAAGAGNDKLFGGAGNDTLSGGAGADTMQGGTGDDLYQVDSVADRVVELAGGGADHIETTLASYTATAGVEDVTYVGSLGFTGVGNALDNRMRGAAGADSLSGGGGNDVLRGGNGNDTLSGGDGNDWLVGDAGASHVTTSNSRPSPSDPNTPITVSMTMPEISTTTSTTVNGYINNATLGDGTFNLAFVLDVSGSMVASFSAGDVGDVNNDGEANTRLDAAIASFEALVESIEASGLGKLVRIALIPFHSSSDIRMIGDAVSDNNGNGVADVIDAARQLDELETTSYDLGLGNAVQFFNDSPDGDNHVFFLSDGEPNGGPYEDLLQTLRDPQGINATIRSLAIGADTSALYDVLDRVDDAQLNDSAVNVGDPDSLTAGLLNSRVNVADIRQLEIYRNGTLVKTLTPDQLSQTPFGLKFSATIAGLGTGGADRIETRVVMKDPQESSISTSQTITVGPVASNDRLLGGAGHDTLDGGAGIDTLVGGTGDDVYRVNSTGDAITELAGEGFDAVESTVTFSLNSAALAQIEALSLLGSTHINASGNALANRIEGNIGNNIIQGLGGNDTLDGGFGMDTVSYATGSTGFTIHLEDGTAVGGSESDSLARFENVQGSRFADHITGTDGDNSFTGGGGNDTLIGDDGHDTVVYAAATAAMTVTLNSSFSGGTATSANGAEGNDSLSGIEGVIGSNFADRITDGNSAFSQANLFLGGGGNDTLSGAGGSDTLVGGAGNDALDGGINSSSTDMDLVDYSSATAAIRGNLAGSITGTSTGTDTLTNFERIVGTRLADSIGGGGVSEKFEGGAGADTLAGGGGDDTLDGGTGADSLNGGAGNDTFLVDAALDVVTEGAGGGTDEVQSAITCTITDVDVENLRLLGKQHVAGTGNAAGNTITGNAGNNTLSGLAGNDSIDAAEGDDTVLGGAGSNILVGGLGRDVLSFANATGGISGTLSSSATAFFSSATGTDTVSQFEHLVGSAFADGFVGDSNNNLLDGGAGNDTLTGEFGDDTLIGGAGNDQLNGGSGLDVLSYAGNAVGIHADLFSGLVTGQGTDTILGSSIESVIGTAQADVIVWSSTATINFSSLTLTGGAGNDSLRGSAGSDTLLGGAGTDTMAGGGGSDTYEVSTLTDVIVDDSTFDRDTVLSAVNYTLGGSFENLTLTGPALIGTGNASSNELTGNARGNTLRGGGGSDTLAGGLGTDTLDGGADLSADHFVFNSVLESRDGSADRVNNFDAASDRIDLRLFDANAFQVGEQSFSFLGTAAFTGLAGQLRVEARGPNTFVLGDVDGDKAADFAVEIVGAHNLTSTNFLL